MQLKMCVLIDFRLSKLLSPKVLVENRCLMMTICFLFFWFYLIFCFFIILSFCLSAFLPVCLVLPSSWAVVLVLQESFCAFLCDGEQKVADGIGWDGWKVIINGFHTWYLSRAPRAYPCKFFLAGVNFYRFIAKNWQFTL